ncbi:hypothetical protein ACPYO6_07410 [Georgenia sp. Z1344]|uniref:hypothetical protein n=1 Tax=Georgenia sp. Z1344 TaxID=3416706 RepID=UPI003CF6FB23
MTAPRRTRALLALATAGALGAAASAGTLALWTASASGEGSIDVLRYDDDPTLSITAEESASDGADSPTDGAGTSGDDPGSRSDAGESPSAGASESASDGPAESPSDAPPESSSDSTHPAGDAVPSESADGPVSSGQHGTSGEDASPEPDAAAPPEPEIEIDPVVVPLPQELVDQIRFDGRGAAVVANDLSPHDLAAVELTLESAVPGLVLRVQARTVDAPERCAESDAVLPVDDGTPIELPGTAELFCLEIETVTTDHTGDVTATGTSDGGDLAVSTPWTVTAHETLTRDDVDVVLTPVIEVTP